MAKDGFLTAKAIANRIKSKGLQKLRWYCQICEKQCRDENGFKCHCASESHQRKILLVAESPEKYVNDYSAEFQRDFMKLLSTRYGTRRVNANLVYQEFISDRTHLHMNATKWASLSEFTMHLGKEGLAIVDETPKGWFMTWIDNSPKTLARQEAIAKKERMEMDDEQREQKLIQQQIQKAALLKTQQSGSGDDQDAEDDSATTELVRENEEEKIKLDISIKPVVSIGLLGAKVGGATASLIKPKSLNALAAKKPNPFSSKSSSSPSAQTQPAASEPLRKRSAAEEIMDRELARKKRLADMNGQGSYSAVGSSESLRDSRNGSSSSSSRFDQRPSSSDSSRPRERDEDRDGRRDRDQDRSRDYDKSSRDSRSSRDRDDRDYRSNRDDRDYRDSRDRERDRDSRSDRNHRDRERDRDSRTERDYRDRDSRDSRDSHRDRERDRS